MGFVRTEGASQGGDAPSDARQSSTGSLLKEEFAGGNTVDAERTHAPASPQLAWRTDGPQLPKDGRIVLSTPIRETSLTMPERQDATDVDVRDLDSPDAWVKRHPDMVRLTGRHPFNSEPPLRKLQEAGWITPPSLHVVRNHGAVPKLSWEEHRLVITGVPRPCQFSMDEIVSGKVGAVVSFPVTFICAGNRRKEQNMVKKTVGFNWGCAAVGNSVWTGVRLCDVLAHVGITAVSSQHRYVCFEGPEGELPQGSTGTYGTSIDMGWALDRERDVLLAFKQNGEWLTPDHGSPLRTILPGCIGGRMIKWLCKMWVQEKPSDNHYHFFDNRVLPPHVDAEMATKEGWWYKPEYMINHMNINSAMFEPRHNSVFRLSDSRNKTLKISGYAYAGSGSKIIRAEVSLDGGRSFEIADLTRPEDEIADARGTDKHWCWAWWETEVDAARLLQCKEIHCRAVDSNQNMQPMHLTWNVMGMLNNCLFCIKVHPLRTPEGPALWFEHPTMPGNESGGWMTEDAGRFDPEKATEAAPGPRGAAPERAAAGYWGAPKAGPPSAVSPTQPTARSAVKPAAEESEGISEEEVAKHNVRSSAWIIVNDRVYDCTPYLDKHPGGASSILLLAGQDATSDFEAVHSKEAWKTLEDHYIGPLRRSAASDVSTADTSASPKIGSAHFLRKEAFQKLPLVEKIEVSHNTRIFRFGLPSPEATLGLPTGMHVFLRAVVDGKTVMRPYTPTSDDATKGHLDLLVKVYFKDEHPDFPAGGKMSQHLDSLHIGDTIEVKGPLGDFMYCGRGALEWRGVPRTCRRFNLLAAGTGLTPCWQVLAAVLRDEADATEVRLVYANRTPADILLRDQLDALAAQHPLRFKLWYTVDRLLEDAGDCTDWAFGLGKVNEVVLTDHLFAPADDLVTLMCGAPGWMENVCMPLLQKIGHQEASIVIA